MGPLENGDGNITVMSAYGIDTFWNPTNSWFGVATELTRSVIYTFEYQRWLSNVFVAEVRPLT